MTWQDSIPPTSPTQPDFKQEADGSIHLAWASSKDNDDLPVTYHLYGSSVYPVDTNKAENLLQTYIRGNETSLEEGKGKRYFAITATDRYGNESEALALNKPSNKDIPILNCGNSLALPKLSEKSRIIICNSIGKIVMESTYQESISLATMNNGLYMVYELKPDGQRALIGSILK